MEVVGFGRSGGARSGTDGGARAGGLARSGTDDVRAGCIARSGTEELVEVRRAPPARRASNLRWRLPAPPHFLFFPFPELLGRYFLEYVRLWQS